MKILLSAYACEPNKGSEPGVGWNWALALSAQGYNVHVLTRSNNRQAIEQARISLDSRMTFYYYDLPQRLRFWKRWPGGIYLYYLLWQIGAYNVARKLHARERFNIVHHITFVSYRQPSFLGGLGIPFIFGPVGGGETMPSQFRRSLPMSGRVSEWIRDIGNRVIGLDPLMRHTYAGANVIACATEETLLAIPGQFHGKCIVQRAIGISDIDAHSDVELDRGAKPSAQLLFVGRLLYWKGLHLVLRALAKVRVEVPEVRLRIIGEGNDGHWLKQEAERWGVADLVDWVARVPHDQIIREYQTSTAFIFPSLHDSGGMVVLEAMSAGLPVICLKVGGPGSIVDASCGFSLDVKQKSEDQVIAELAVAIRQLSTDRELHYVLAEGARLRASTLTWSAAAEAVYARASDTESDQVTVGE